MNILFVTASYYPAIRYGGPTYTVHALARELVRRGNNVSVYTTDVDGDARTPLGRTQLDGVEIHYFHSDWNRIYWSRGMISALERTARVFDVVHAHGAFMWTTVSARHAAVANATPFAFSPRGMLVEGLIRRKNNLAKRIWIRAFERENIRNADFVHVTSWEEAREVERLRMPCRSIEVIYNGVEIPESRNALDRQRRKNLLQDDYRYILILGRVTWNKGIDRLTQAMVHIPSVRLVIAGNDEEGYTKTIVELARRLSVSDRIVLLGPVYGDDKFALLRGAELFALPSYSESFGVAAAEAMASGCCVIVTRGVGIAPLIEEAGAGICVNDDPQAIGAAIAALLADPARKKMMGERGRRAALKLFSWDGIAAKMEAAYMRHVTRSVPNLASSRSVEA